MMWEGPPSLTGVASAPPAARPPPRPRRGRAAADVENQGARGRPQQLPDINEPR